MLRSETTAKSGRPDFAYAGYASKLSYGYVRQSKLSAKHTEESWYLFWKHPIIVL